MAEFKQNTMLHLHSFIRNRSLPNSTNSPSMSMHTNTIFRAKSQIIHSHNNLIAHSHRSYSHCKLQFKRKLSEVSDISIQFTQIPKHNHILSLNLPDTTLQNALTTLSPIYGTNQETVKPELPVFVESEPKKDEEDSRRDFSYHSSENEKSITHYPNKFISQTSKIFVPSFQEEQKSECEEFRLSKVISNRNIDSINEQITDKTDQKLEALKSTKSHTNSEIALSVSKRSISTITGHKLPLMSSPSYKLSANELRKDIHNADMRLSIIQESMAKQDTKITEQNAQLLKYMDEIRKLDAERKALDSRLMDSAQSIQHNRTMYDFLLQYMVNIQSNIPKKFH